MKSCRIILFCVILMSLSLSCGDLRLSDRSSPIDIALNQVGLTRETLTFDYGDMSNYGGDKFVLPLFYTLHSDFFKIERYTNDFKQSVKSNADNLQNLVSFASRRLDEGVRRGLIGDPLDSIFPLLNHPDPLYNSVMELYTRSMALPWPVDHEQLKTQAQSIPVELQRVAALIIYASIDTLEYHRRAFEKAASEFDLHDMYSRAQKILASDQDIVDFSLEPFAEKVDFKYLYTHAQDIAHAVDIAVDSLAALSFNTNFSLRWDTPLGMIAIGGRGKDIYPAGDYFLIIDVGGNDRYEGGGANGSVDNWMSILIDLDGNDVYESKNDDSPAFGAGVMGYAFLVDMNGNDTYIGRNMTGGIGLFGVGALLDMHGTDKYDGFICAQGCGQFGIGILSDLEGKDSYHAYLLAQGFGFTKGMGILVDMTGDDDYYADTLDIQFPASQSKDYNSNLAQGVGFGKRADYIDGHSWAGGIGMLVDAEGNDTYSAGLFAQGCAYWYAIGILADDTGDDIYNGVWYVQGSGAHFGLGILIDSSGNDHYTATMNMAQGAGHDFTLGTLIDCGGDDIHDAPNLSLGGGNANGIGIYWDKSGDDTYRVSASTTLGRSNIASRGGLRDHIFNLGLFLDTGGNDTYPTDEKFSFARNNAVWTQHGTNTEQPLEVEKGVGYDCEW
ncbi:MAG: hypothetical protein ABIK83_08000 [Candidatus Zixiibacteriota bacterium]